MKIWFTHPIWTHNLYMWMEFAPLYKGVILTVQNKCTTIQVAYKTTLCEGFQSILDNSFLFFLSSKDYKLSCHTFLHHSSITQPFHALYLTHMWQFEYLPTNDIWDIFFCFMSSTIFWTKPLEIWFIHPMWIHDLCMCMEFTPLYKGVTLIVQR